MAVEYRSTAPGEHGELLRRLIGRGHLIESGVQGVYGHGAEFERLRNRLTEVVSDIAAVDGATLLGFPPIVPRHTLETVGYLDNFPHLAGSVFGFDGTESDARLLAQRACAHEDWSELQSQTDMMMLPAACYPVYPALAAGGPLEPGGATVDIGSAWVFRHEPSGDPARRQAFHMHEIVRAAAPEVVAQWRVDWAQRGEQLFAELGLDGRRENASDPFFGRVGRLRADSQEAEELKWELTVQIAGPERTACASFNYAQDHFAEIWGLEMKDGSPVHTACAAFGQERIVLALLATHGLDPDRWPADVLLRLGD